MTFKAPATRETIHFLHVYYYPTFLSPLYRSMKRQLAFLIARAQVPIEWVQREDESEEEPEQDLLECLSNTHLAEHFKEFGKELGVLEPKSLEDIYKSHLEVSRKFVK